MRLRHLAFLAALAVAPAAAQESAPAPTPAPASPQLVVAISVDQLSSDLFEQYRPHYTGGLARLLSGAAFPSGFQSHAATETCPGHSTILTGVHPARNGIIANDWMAKDKTGKLVEVYCAEDEANKPASGQGYTPSAVHLLVPTLGDRVKARWPGSKNVAVSGKDRGALMMAGGNADTIYFRWGSGFGTVAGKQLGLEAQALNAEVKTLLTEGAPAIKAPAWCEARDRAIPLGNFSVGAGRFELKPGDFAGFSRSPRYDEVTVELAKRLIDGEKLGADGEPDVLSVSLSATDYVGHAYGTNGIESCIQVAELDRMLGELFDALDAKGIDYVAMLTADHGGIDLPERASEQGVPAARRVDASFVPAIMGKALGEVLRIKGPVFAGGSPAGDVWFDTALSAKDRARVTAAVRAKVAKSDDVAAVFTAAELAAAPAPSGDPRTWTLVQRAKASYYPGRSGDLVMLLAPAVQPVPEPRPGIVATHGSPWDYDRRVPILFWRKGMAQVEQPFPIETVDVAPTLAAILGLTAESGAFDGRCLDLDSGPGSTCER